ncbi:hypothetical protein Hanom_Chr09g00849151 [Helianthus anomalus]
MKLELELDSRVKPKARAQLDLARTILRTTLNDIKVRLELTSTSLKRAKAWLELDSSMLSSLLIYNI